MIMVLRLGWATDMTTEPSPLDETDLELPPDGIYVVASLVVDPSGRVRDGRDSRPLSSPEDRRRFLGLRRWAQVILIGSKTFSAESYGKSKLPVLTYSRKEREITDWSHELLRVQESHGRRVLIEAGPGLLEPMIRHNVVDRLFLTRTSRVSSDATSPIFDFSLLENSSLELISSEVLAEDRFEIYQRKMS